MKRKYIVPSIETINMTSKDVITLSAGENGSISSYSFKNILDNNAGWIEVD